MSTADKILNFEYPRIEPYKKNFLQQSVCEFKFPTLMELGGIKPPDKLVHSLRKEYPHLELTNEVTLGLGTSNSDANNTHIFRSPKYDWAISIRKSSVTIETTSYHGFEGLKERVKFLLDSIKDIIDTDFFTRIGLRYINVIDVGDDRLDDWINNTLVAPISSNSFNFIQEYAGRLQLGSEDGGCIIQHGLKLKKDSKYSKLTPEYMLDIDGFRNVVKLTDALESLDKIHQQTSSIFHWALGQKALNYLKG